MKTPPVIPFAAWLALAGLLGWLPGFGGNARADVTITELRCESRVNPLGLDTPQPRFSWGLQSSRRGEIQTAYQIFVSSSPARLARGEIDLWDSGKVHSRASVHVPYAGRSLRPGQRVWWKVRAWDAAGKVSRSSAPAWFEMALLSPEDWQAHWIQRSAPAPLAEEHMFDDHPAPLFRKEFTLDKKVARARAYVSGLGYYELRLNGAKVGDQVLDPGWTRYSRRVLYSTYDVTAQLKRGRNAVGFMLGNGWFNPLPLRMWGRINPRDALTIGEPRALLQLVIEFTDGSTETIVTDESWRVGDGPIRRNSIFLGEVYDARHEQPGWDQAGFDDAAWESAVLATEPKLGPLRAQDAPPIRVTRRLAPVRLTEPQPGVFIFDFGQNFAGWARLRVKGPAGTRVRLRSGELLYDDGTLNGMTAVCGQIKGGGKDYRYEGQGQPKTAFQLDEYILKGQGTEIFTPRFTFHGFRYVEVTGFPGRPTLGALEGLRLNADVTPVGSFECSNPMFNRIQQMTQWTLLANLFSVQSDCPHREKLGYGGDIVTSSEMAMLNFDMARFYAKAAQDLVDDVRPNGGFTETAPYVGISDEGLGEQSGPVGWGTAQPLLLWQLRQYYGEHRLAEEHYAATKRWIALLHEQARDGILDNGISDHESLAPKPRALTGTAFYYFNVQLFAQLARALGRDGDALAAEAQLQDIQAAFNQKFLEAGTGRYDIASQACQAFALYHELVPTAEKSQALEVLLRDIAAQDGHLTTGIFGTKYLLHALTDAGRADTAYAMVNQRTFPGWGYMLEKGATTLWEHWAFSDNTYSHNHPMFGSVSEWFYKALAGIAPAPEAVGFDQILIQPQPVGDLQWAKASYQSVRGRVASAWEKTGSEFKLRVTIPANATATVHVPAAADATITESGRPAERAPGVRLLRKTDRATVFTVGSGQYEFKVR
ncbi:MAG: Bacterial alpha-L-rhamnosidase [Verrucomicrobia bacterium ADurb.Bin118]|jgi:alpha-L-rhamnosidase|nr:family 78 glycoside hydrolase catalytic domain [Verrucomicrobiota bacterium]OQB90689.1 MAG: Bacterial alpha-L-rhamnosidase [Verrucomicrobia bacterium ADurb.Bin118]